MNKQLAAVIVETRPLPNLKQVIENHLKFLPDYTVLYVFGSIAVESIVDEMSMPYKFIRVDGVINESEYNKLLTSTTFWNLISEENILIFQHDSEILRTGIEDFYEFNYVGAPWKFKPFAGNGGLSFRNKHIMIGILKNNIYNQSKHGNEDVFFCNVLFGDHPEITTYFKKELDVCKQFSCETIFQLGTLGCHAIDRYLTKEQCEQIRNQYK